MNRFSVGHCSVFDFMATGRHRINPWLELLDIIGPATDIPPQLRRLFWTKNLTRPHRFALGLFCRSNAA